MDCLDGAGGAEDVHGVPSHHARGAFPPTPHAPDNQEMFDPGNLVSGRKFSRVSVDMACRPERRGRVCVYVNASWSTEYQSVAS